MIQEKNLYKFIENIKLLILIRMKRFVEARVEKIIRNGGTHRVSADAIEELNERITTHRMEIATKAVNIAQHSD